MTDTYPGLDRLPYQELQALVHELGMAAAHAAHRLAPPARADIYNRGSSGTRLILAHYRMQLTPEEEREATASQRDRSPGE